MHAKGSNEMFRFELDDLRYRVLRFQDGELVVTVAGDPFRLGLLTKEDAAWDWDGTDNIPLVQETTLQVPVGAQAARVTRMVARHLAAYLIKHQPAFFYYRLTDEAPRRQRLYERLLGRYPQLQQLYEATADETGMFQMFTLRGDAQAL